MKRATRATSAKRIEERKASGLDATVFAAKLEARGYAAHVGTLKWWTWQLGEHSRRKPKAVAPKADRGEAAPMTFVEMTGVVRGHALERAAELREVHRGVRWLGTGRPQPTS